MSDTIDIHIINDLKEGAGKMQESINSSSLSKEQKDLNTAKVREALNILEKGTNMTAQDMNRVSGILRSITQTLVRAYAGTEKVVAGLSELQAKLQKEIEAREQARTKQKDLRQHKIKVNDETGEIGIRKAEVGRMLKENPVKNTRGENYTSVDAVYKAAEAGNEAAKQFLETVKQRLEELKAEYSQAKTEEATASENIKTTTGEIDKLKSDSPEDSVAVQMQEFGNELQNLIDKLKELSGNAGGGGGPSSSGDSGEGEEGEALSAEDLDKVTASQNKQNSSLGKAFKQFTIYAIAVRTVKKALKEAVNTVKELDKYLTEQAMVTGKTRKETYSLLKSYQQMAKQLGATTKEVAQVATQFMRQGKTTAESLTLTNAAISAAKVAGISAAESVDYLTTALNGFQLSAQKAMEVSDKFASIAAQSATSYEEIATALSKVAAQANMAGMSIDYTTALLAKGIETTREAPETIGTALKTVIARMREMGDYGETLSGDENINNVERQLAYVGIALRDTNGELRSTEDVLDELGHKWDDLNSNQQAAIAKALAGTRQQSRLIAMMSDYERVVELQEIAERSQGATMAQMATYTEGMEAALNAVSVAWEKIVTALTNSEVIIGFVDTFATILDVISKILGQWYVLIPLITLATALTIGWLGAKLKQVKAAKDHAKAEAAIRTQNLKNLIASLKNLKAEKKITKEKNQQRINELQAQKNKGKLSAAEAQELKMLKAQNKEIDQQIEGIDGEIQAAEYQLKQSETQLSTTSQIGSWIDNIKNGLLALVAPIAIIIGLVKVWWAGQKAVNQAKAKGITLTKEQKKEAMKEAAAEGTGMFAGIVKAFSSGGIPGVIAGIAIAAALMLALFGTAIGGAVSGGFKSGSERAADNINGLSKEIYQLTKQAEALESVVKQFDAIDQKVLKTNKDIEEMNSLLEGAGDELNSEDPGDKEDVGYGEGVSQKEYYDSLEGAEAKRKFLEEEAAKDREKADKKRREQLEQFNFLQKYSSSEFRKLMEDDTASAISARQALYAMNNNTAYEYIDTLKTENTTVDNLTAALLDQLDAYEALDYANNPQKINAIVDALVDLKTTVNDTNDALRTQVYVTDVLTSDDYSIKDKTEAWREAREALASNQDALEGFINAYKEYEVFSRMDDSVLDLIDSLGIGVDKINELAAAYKKLNAVGIDVDKDYWSTVLETYAATGRNMEQTIEIVFGTYLNALGQGTEEYVKAYNAVVHVMEDLLADSVLNIGQNMDKLKNSVSSIYEKANEWNTMSETDKTQFLIDNADLFTGTDGEQLLQAFQTGNYAAIEKALASNGALQKQLDQELQDIEERLKVEENRKGDEYNQSLVDYLRQQKKLLEDGTKIFQASLEDRLELEQKQLDIYKDYLSKQKDALEESLDKRKEAYQKYFDTINQEQEDEDYEEEANTLIANLSKLSSSTDAASQAQSKQLEQKLEDLEKERLQTLRERAQEQVISNIDEEIQAISDKFDKLLDTDAEILQAMQADLEDSDFMSKMLTNGLAGKTLLEAEDYLENTFKPAFGSVADLSDVTIEQNRAGDLILNIAGRQINLSQTDSDNLADLIYEALSRLGITV